MQLYTDVHVPQYQLHHASKDLSVIVSSVSQSALVTSLTTRTYNTNAVPYALNLGAAEAIFSKACDHIKSAGGSSSSSSQLDELLCVCLHTHKQMPQATPRHSRAAIRPRHHKILDDSSTQEEALYNDDGGAQVRHRESFLGCGRC